MRNYFAHLWPWLGDAMATAAAPWIVTGIGVVTALAGVRDLVSALGSKRPEGRTPTVTPADGPRP